MTPEEFVKLALDKGTITPRHIAALTWYYQTNQKVAALNVDGKPGPLTLSAVESGLSWLLVAPKPPPAPDPRAVGPFLASPMPLLPGRMTPQARKAVITSGFRPADRKDHNGCDFFYRWEEGDQPRFVGDGGCEGKDLNGNPKWVVPYDTCALAAADGVVQTAGPSATGYRVWIDHGNGLRSGYFHLENVFYRAGAKVTKGTAIGRIGHNPADADGRHLHFEVSPVEKYEPLDPERYLIK